MSRAGRQPKLFTLGEATHPGETGKNNEDSYGHISIPVADNLAHEIIVAVVADGIGGQQAGEEAANLAVQAVKDHFLAYSRATNIPGALRQALWNANLLINKRSRERDLFQDMGTTAAVAVISDNNLYIANVGDSRIYLISAEGCTQLSTDHSWGQEAIEAGRISPEEARSHPNRNVLKRYLGINPDVEVDLRIRTPGAGPTEYQSFCKAPVRVEQGDTILLCTDGLTDLVSDAEIWAAVQKYSPQHAADHLIRMACRRGGHDNITVLILRLGEAPPEPLRERIEGMRTLAVAGLMAVILLSSATLALSGRLRLGPSESVAAAQVTPSVPPAVSSRQQPANPSHPASSGRTSGTPRATAVAQQGNDEPVAVAGPVEEPTSTPVPTRTPPPTSTPWPTWTAPPPPPVPPPAPPPGAPPRSSIPSMEPPSAQQPAAPLPNEPADGDSRAGRVTFRWTPAGPLPAGAAYEVVWWRRGENPANARGIAAVTTDTSLSADLDVLRASGQMPPDGLLWSVIVVQKAPYVRLTLPAPQNTRHLSYRHEQAPAPIAPSPTATSIR